PLCQDVARRLVDHLVAVAGPRGREPGQLRAQHDLVDRALRGGEAPVDGEGTGDIRRVVAPLAAGVDQEQLAVLHLARVLHVVEDARVGPRGDDRGVRVARRALAPEDELERRLHLVLVEPRPRVAHRFDVGVAARPAGAPRSRGRTKRTYRSFVCAGLTTATASGSSKPVRKKKSELWRNS